MKSKKDAYEDIIDLPHPISKKHTLMSNHDRAAQFSPFAALTGHKEAIYESGRVTEAKKILDESQKELINAVLLKIQLIIKEKPSVSVTYFEYDEKKEGGTYTTVIKKIKKINEIEQVLIFVDYSEIAIDDIFMLEIVV